jgi:3'(2'), 5'-bisphosphate nucleotidase
MTMPQPSQTLLELAKLAQIAGQAIMAIYNGDMNTRIKSDHSPVTDADERAEKIILTGLTTSFPTIPVVAEEAAAAGQIPKIQNRFFLVDPLDGTKEFISRNGEFTVNIALIENQLPVLGVVYAPAINQIYLGQKSEGCWCATLGVDFDFTKIAWTNIRVRPLPPEGATVLASRSHRDAETDAYLAKCKVKEIIGAGSSLKFCTIAEGKADLYPRFGRTMEWDTAAGHAVLSAAGGKVMQPDGEPLLYGKVARGYDNPAFIASAH